MRICIIYNNLIFINKMIHALINQKYDYQKYYSG